MGYAYTFLVGLGTKPHEEREKDEMTRKHTPESLNELSSRQIVDIYNEMAEKLELTKVNKFSSKSVGITRTLKLQSLLPEVETPAEYTPKSVLRVLPLPKEINRVPNCKYRETYSPTKSNFNRPFVDGRGCKREGTIRWQLVNLLRAGTTFAGVVRLIEDYDAAQERVSANATRRAYDNLCLVHDAMGYGMHHDLDTGIITLIEE